ncbi:glycoside hydrolase family 15 protein [Anaeromyxobacter sp. PSR-1]|uniref:glycoside hydrolase family 15 protein n=1 Tax=Anaeromyxobacter sp. PSR-1 TaxID=1300915 RepID=UPI0005E4D502|nr:glycoside hydrolase family 15 protein [Anaeromyxobacter sp. PSR-1]GAO02399.1 trehalase [Anaeromyxobacter sp. PSR-1]
MAQRLEEYAMVGDAQSAALVGRDGSVDWLCWPRFDSDACFAALLGAPEHGRFSLRPAGEVRAVRRAYRPGTLVLDTELSTAEGAVRIVDFMPPRGAAPDLVRLVQGLRGRVELDLELSPRFGYGARRPWIRGRGRHLSASAGPDTLHLIGEVPLRAEHGTIRARFAVAAGESAPFVLTWHPSHQPAPTPPEPGAALEATEAWWRRWSGRCTAGGRWHALLVQSLVVLKALTYARTGGIVAAPSTSLPEAPGGVRNWDYRFCWLRDATFTLLALMGAGYVDEARAWRDWLLRAVAGQPEDLQIMYGIAGERRLTELELPWLPGYEGARPVRIGNAASSQLQLDVFGEVLDCLHQAHLSGLPFSADAWTVQRALLDWLESHWDDPDEGIWEIRGPRRDFTHSKVMAWVAVDRALRSARAGRLDGPLDRWRALRARIHAEVCARGYDAERGAFTQAFGSKALDASLLLVPQVGFLPATDPRVGGTIAAIERELTEGGLVHRYDSRTGVDGLPPGEGVFLACTLWLSDALRMQGRHAEAARYFERVVGLANDVGLLAEQWDPVQRRLVGNFPQAFSHVALVNAALGLSGPAPHRSGRCPEGDCD